MGASPGCRTDGRRLAARRAREGGTGQARGRVPGRSPARRDAADHHSGRGCRSPRAAPKPDGPGARAAAGRPPRPGAGGGDHRGRAEEDRRRQHAGAGRPAGAKDPPGRQGQDRRGARSPRRSAKHHARRAETAPALRPADARPSQRRAEPRQQPGRHQRGTDNEPGACGQPGAGCAVVARPRFSAAEPVAPGPRAAGKRARGGGSAGQGPNHGCVFEASIVRPRIRRHERGGDRPQRPGRPA